VLRLCTRMADNCDHVWWWYRIREGLAHNCYCVRWWYRVGVRIADNRNRVRWRTWFGARIADNRERVQWSNLFGERITDNRDRVQWSNLFWERIAGNRDLAGWWTYKDLLKFGCFRSQRKIEEKVLLLCKSKNVFNVPSLRVTTPLGYRLENLWLMRSNGMRTLASKDYPNKTVTRKWRNHCESFSSIHLKEKGYVLPWTYPSLIKLALRFSHTFP
jgi:hypothetical protein